MVSASREIAADAGPIFELIADPAQQPRWDGNDNLAEAAAGQRVRRAGDVFIMTITSGAIRHNHVVEFKEGRLTDGTRIPRAQATTADKLRASADRLAALAEGLPSGRS